MKNLKTYFLFAAVLFATATVSAQDYLMTLKPLSASVLDLKEETKETPLIKDKTFSYQYKGEDVLVVFEGKEHFEFYNNKKHFIKSDLLWTSKDECYMIIRDFNLPNFPFKAGTKMRMKITKVENGFIHYTSTLGGRTWKGKMKESDVK